FCSFSPGCIILHTYPNLISVFKALPLTCNHLFSKYDAPAKSRGMKNADIIHAPCHALGVVRVT
ncbi:hypothetical protein, partial [Desulfonatronospira sp.]|uniref:hypothetical protein n=1 Tax=Desulfonatronospira sp. TaxID=1962951 RepID=UPI0025BB8C72